ncbi:MAG: hypothetical protein WBP45_04550 [Daejeonella sp.]
MKFDKDKYKFHPFIADGMMSVPKLGEGRLIPCVILEKNFSSEIAELCKIHEDTPPGDVETTWVRSFSFSKPKYVVLKIKFKNPIELTFGIIFNISKHYNLIDGIILSQTLNLEVGEIGDKVSDLKNKGILIEVQRTNFSSAWQPYLEYALKKKYRDKGVAKQQINELVKQHIKTMREVWNYRRN